MRTEFQSDRVAEFQRSRMEECRVVAKKQKGSTPKVPRPAKRDRDKQGMPYERRDTGQQDSFLKSGLRRVNKPRTEQKRPSSPGVSKLTSVESRSSERSCVI